MVLLFVLLPWNVGWAQSVEVIGIINGDTIYHLFDTTTTRFSYDSSQRVDTVVFPEDWVLGEWFRDELRRMIDSALAERDMIRNFGAAVVKAMRPDSCMKYDTAWVEVTHISPMDTTLIYYNGMVTTSWEVYSIDSAWGACGND